MAAKSAEGTQTIENEETPGDCSGKKKSKFQAFKKLFVKKKRKESPAPSRESNLKPSQSSSDVSVSGANESAFQPAHESVAKSNMGSKAVSHDSIFISEVENSTKEDTSQENTPSKVKALQLQLQQNLRIGSPPQGILHKKLEDSGALSEDDGLPRSPPEITSLHEILALSSGKTLGIAQRRSSLSLGGTDSEDEPESCETSSCPISPLNSSILSSNSPGSHYLVDFTAPPSSLVCLDNSAAKHKIAVKPKKKSVMNLHRIKDGTGFTKDLHFKLKEKMENKVASEDKVHIPYSGENSAEQDVPKEQAKCIEDKIEETETMSLTEHEDSSVRKTQNYGTCFAEKQIMSLPDETDESDVDFHASYLTVEDQVNGNEEDTEIERKSTGVPHISHSTPMHELDEVTAQLEPSEMEDNAVETVHLEVGEDVECDIFKDPLKIQKNTLAFENDEPIVNDKDQEHKEYGKVLPNLTELQEDILEVTASTSDTRVVSIPQKHIMETESEISVIKVDKSVPNVASECILIFESTDNEKTSETSSTNAMTDQLTIIDTLSTDEKVETLGPRIIETPKDTSFNDGHSKCSSSSLNLGSGENGSSDIQDTNEYATETSKTIKTNDSNVDSKLRASNKPVRFTVAPAWQRSLSVGGNVKDGSYSKNKISSTMKSESFDGSEDLTMVINQEDYRKGENKEDSGVAFGIRLRRTSSSKKYNEEYPEEQSKLYTSPVETGSIVPTQTIQTPTKTAQPLQSETSKASKPSHTAEDKPQKKQKAEDLSSHESTGPSWITVAKLKQKGFQDHPLAREHSPMAEGDTSEGDGESSQKRSAAASQELDVKETEPISESPVIQSNLPESGKNAQSAPPQNPDEPPWFSLAKKKAKAWSKMPQIVQ
ncbi:acrosomal protein KIAA1210 homolog [Rana temporaria]|uniref:acrosomal protein KIAA1210 homolog n=1 Tax=Rana temporaria TaxID=8407 RepID=UPI001AADE97A|nr:acrosomal protein KIAA1210 homolog [Rana temporaria]